MTDFTKKDYLLFLDREDGKYGDHDSLEDHLNELQEYGGTPDFWDEAVGMFEAVEKANSTDKKVYIVDKDTMCVAAAKGALKTFGK